jgi:hypothetical protein
MRILRRRLASGALVLSVLQLAVLFAAPVSVCCAKAGAAASIAAASDDAPDCCPPGAHPKGECPLHRGHKRMHCRMTCDRSGPPQLLLGSIGVLPPPAAVIVSFTHSRLAAPARSAIVVRPLVPDSPPPELL